MPGLIAALKNEKAAYWACLVLRDMGPAAKDAVPALTEKLQDPLPEIRREAILALAAMDEAAAAAVPQIAAALGDEHTCPAATYALGRIGQIPADAEATIRANVQSDDKMLSITSLWALTRVHPEDKQIRREAARAIDRAAEGRGSARAVGGCAGVGRVAAGSGDHRPAFGKRRFKTRTRRPSATPWTPWRRWVRRPCRGWSTP